jgi:hypothetical protein
MEFRSLSRFDWALWATHILLDPQYLLHQELLTGLQGVVTIDSARLEADVTLLAALFHVGDFGGTFSRVPRGDAEGRKGRSRSAYWT